VLVLFKTRYMKKIHLVAILLLGSFLKVQGQVVDIKQSEVPKVVVDSFYKYFPNANKEVQWEKEGDNYEVIYEETRAALLSPDGTLIANNNAIMPENLPESILNYFRENEPKERILSAQREIMQADGSVFFLVITKKSMYKFNPLGKLISKDKYDKSDDEVEISTSK
jgi:hypothetical protein